MKRIKAIFYKRVSVVILILSLLYLGAITSSSIGSNASSSTNPLEKMRLDWEKRKEQLRAEDIRVVNKTKGITLLSIEKVDGRLKLQLRNDSGKVITAYEVAISKMTIHTECLTGSDYNDLFLPGDIREERYAMQTGVDTIGVKILAAIFEDGTDDGDSEYIKEMRQYRSGMKIYREKSLALLKRLVSSKTIGIQSALANIEASLPQISEQQKEMPYFVKAGLEDEQSRFLRLVRTLKDRDYDAQVGNKDTERIRKQKLTRIIENYSKTLPQL